VTKIGERLLQSALLAGLIANMAACIDTADQKPSGPSLTDGEKVTEAEQKTVPLPMNLNGQIAFSKKDLAQRLDVPPESVALSGARQVTWRSGALGCPEPGMNYTEALVPGSVIYLQADNVIHAYHAKFAGNPFYCPRERVEPPVAGEEGDLT
jgi:hypothetical protein